MKNLRIYSCDKKIPKQKIHNFIKFILEDFELSLNSLELNFIKASKIKEINKIYLSHDYSTDIITFNYSENKSVIDGEIFISVDDAAENAKKYKVKYIEEIARLIIHGILHLIGFDDLKSGQRKKMKIQENRLLKKYKFILLR
ncbi:MAG: rRNA maturation RNase YbeY [Ignavibacterium album]|uniref:rRNA maturation RNase YbeY n=1 Tax=Ignavibacterium album TaxID=591197 RepID=UPI0026EF8390|nr:rRNA maturation RNase YbeY [Ignavibacterium album]MCX8105352.1 rRNA maturation RNase YbeY [Ignavibacterium album]